MKDDAAKMSHEEATLLHSIDKAEERRFSFLGLFSGFSCLFFFFSFPFLFLFFFFRRKEKYKKSIRKAKKSIRKVNIEN